LRGENEMKKFYYSATLDVSYNETKVSVLPITEDQISPTLGPVISVKTLALEASLLSTNNIFGVHRRIIELDVEKKEREYIIGSMAFEFSTIEEAKAALDKYILTHVKHEIVSIVDRYKTIRPNGDNKSPINLK